MSLLYVINQSKKVVTRIPIKESGTYEVKWDASGEPSGVYFYRLEAGGFIETKKMVLLR